MNSKANLTPPTDAFFYGHDVSDCEPTDVAMEAAQDPFANGEMPCGSLFHPQKIQRMVFRSLFAAFLTVPFCELPQKIFETFNLKKQLF